MPPARDAMLCGGFEISASASAASLVTRSMDSSSDPPQSVVGSVMGPDNDHFDFSGEKRRVEKGGREHGASRGLHPLGKAGGGGGGGVAGLSREDEDLINEMFEHEEEERDSGRALIPVQIKSSYDAGSHNAEIDEMLREDESFFQSSLGLGISGSSPPAALQANHLLGAVAAAVGGEGVTGIDTVSGAKDVGWQGEGEGGRPSGAEVPRRVGLLPIAGVALQSQDAGESVEGISGLGVGSVKAADCTEVQQLDLSYEGEDVEAYCCSVQALGWTCLSVAHPVRRACLRLVASPIATGMLSTANLACCILLAAAPDTFARTSAWGQRTHVRDGRNFGAPSAAAQLHLVEHIFFGILALEMLIGIIAWGVSGKGAWIARSHLHVIDVLIFVCCLVSYALRVRRVRISRACLC